LQLDPLEVEVGWEDTSVGKIVGKAISVSVAVRIEIVSVATGIAVAFWASTVCAAEV